MIYSIIMKKFIIFFLLSLASICVLKAYAQDIIASDTVRTLRPDSVIVIESDSVTQMCVYGRLNDPNYRMVYTVSKPTDAYTQIEEHNSKWDFTLPFQKTEPAKGKDIVFNGFDMMHLGVMLPIDKTNVVKSNVGLNVGGDLVNVEFVLPNRKNHFFIGVGAEANLLWQDKSVAWQKLDGKLTANAYRADSYKHRSLLSYTALTLPLCYQHDFGREFLVRLAVIPQYVVAAHVVNHYKIAACSYTDKYKNVPINRFNLAFRIDFATRSAGGVYVQYMPFNTFKDGNPANFKMLSVGWTL